MRLAKALIRLRVCAGWSEPLLVAHTTLLEISCCGSYVILCHGRHFCSHIRLPLAIWNQHVALVSSFQVFEQDSGDDSGTD